MRSEIDIVLAWHDAVNHGDTGRLADLLSDDVEIGGPRGSARGCDAFIDWVERTGIRMEPNGWYQRRGTVIVSQQAQWPDDSGALGDPIAVATAFTIQDDRIRFVARYADLAEAFAATGLSERDSVSE